MSGSVGSSMDSIGGGGELRFLQRVGQSCCFCFHLLCLQVSSLCFFSFFASLFPYFLLFLIFIACFFSLYRLPYLLLCHSFFPSISSFCLLHFSLSYSTSVFVFPCSCLFPPICLNFPYFQPFFC